MLINKIFTIVRCLGSYELWGQMFSLFYMDNSKTPTSSLSVVENKTFAINIRKLNIKYFFIPSSIETSLSAEVQLLRNNYNKVSDFITWFIERISKIERDYKNSVKKYEDALKLIDILTGKYVPSKTYFLTLENLKTEFIKISYHFEKSLFPTINENTEKKELKEMKKINSYIDSKYTPKYEKNAKDAKMKRTQKNAKDTLLVDENIAVIFKEFKISSFLKTCVILKLKIEENLERLKRFEIKIKLRINKYFNDIKNFSKTQPLNVNNNDGNYIKEEHCLKLFYFDLKTLYLKFKIKLKNVRNLEKKIDEVVKKYKQLNELLRKFNSELKCKRQNQK